jgi:hypothetical protein
MANVQITVGFRWKARCNMAVFAAGKIALNDGAKEI